MNSLLTITPKKIEILERKIKFDMKLHGYNRKEAIKDILQHAKIISKITKGESGFFGIGFPALISYLKKLK